MSVVVGLVYFNLATDQSSMRDRFGMMYILGALYPYMVVLDLIGVCTYTCTQNVWFNITVKSANKELIGTKKICSLQSQFLIIL